MNGRKWVVLIVIVVDVLLIGWWVYEAYLQYKHSDESMRICMSPCQKAYQKNTISNVDLKSDNRCSCGYRAAGTTGISWLGDVNPNDISDVICDDSPNKECNARLLCPTVNTTQWMNGGCGMNYRYLTGQQVILSEPTTDNTSAEELLKVGEAIIRQNEAR